MPLEDVTPLKVKRVVPSQVLEFKGVCVWLLHNSQLFPAVPLLSLAHYLLQAGLYMQLDHPTCVLAAGPQGLLQRAADTWRFRSRWGVQVSDLQQQVAESLTRLGLRYSVEVG